MVATGFPDSDMRNIGAFSAVGIDGKTTRPTGVVLFRRIDGLAVFGTALPSFSVPITRMSHPTYVGARESADQVVMTTALLIALALSGLTLLFSTPDKLIESMEGLPEVGVAPQ